MDNPTAEQLLAYRDNPMGYWGASRVRTSDGIKLVSDVWPPHHVEAFEVLAECGKAVIAGRKPPYRGLLLDWTKCGGKDFVLAKFVTFLLTFAQWRLLIELAADDQEQAMETYKSVEEDLALTPWKAEPLILQRNKIIRRDIRSEAVFLTRDAFGGHGSRPSVTICNELSHVQSEVFMQTVMDNADKMADNFVVIATNAGTLGTWQHRWVQQYRADPDWRFIKFAKRADWVPSKNVKAAEKRNPPSRQRQLYEGVWTPPGGDALAEESIRKACVHELPLNHRSDQFHGGGIGVDIGLTNHHSALVVVLTDYQQQRIRVARVVDFPPPVDLSDVVWGIKDAARDFDCNFLAYDPYEMQRISQELAADGFHVEECRPTPKVMTLQSATMREVFREGTIELYTRGGGALLIEDLYSTRVVERHYGERLEWPENENGHCDRAAALANILPHAVAGLGQPPEPARRFDDGLGSNLVRAVGGMT